MFYKIEVNMNDKVLFADDEINVLEGIRRQLRTVHDTTIALGPQKGLQAVKEHGPFAVIVSDLRMPEMDGIEFLKKVREKHPDTVRMILTGNADLKAAIEAVNEGSVFRFLTKPCHTTALSMAVSTGIEQYRLVTSEKELLEKTLKGCINMLTDVLALVNPEAFGRASRIRKYCSEIASIFEVKNLWQMETAALLSQIGCVVLSNEALKKIYKGQELAANEKAAYEKHPMIGQDLLSNIPRMEEVAEIIKCQNFVYDSFGMKEQDLQGNEIPLEARILKAVLDFDMLESKGLPKGMAFKKLKDGQGIYDPEVLEVFEHILGTELTYRMEEVSMDELRIAMILAEDIRTKDGVLLISRGQVITEVILSRLNSMAGHSRIKEPIKVFVSGS
ncbi:MAG: response regulator [Desulfobacteraceae bacterium]|nr:response regulator [Desulfobacteraceae bacterium]